MTKKTLSIDELLAVAMQKEKKKLRCENHVGVGKYIDRVGWQTGTVLIPTTVIFWHYRKVYDGVDINNKANKTVFFRTFNKRFKSFRKNKQRYYLLNDGIINLTQELYEECKRYDKQHWQKKPRKKKTVRLPGQEGNNGN